VSEMEHNGLSHGLWTMPADPHQEFEELCALSTTGELTVEEWARLTKHLAECDSCREACKEYDQLIAMALPVLGVESGSELDGEEVPGVWSIEDAEKRLMESLKAEPTPSLRRPAPGRASASRKHWWRYAAAAMVLAACSFAGYRIGVHRGPGSAAAVGSARPTASNIQQGLNPSVGANVPAQENRTAPADDQAAALRKQARLDQGEITSLNNQLNQVERELADRSLDLDRSVEERADLNQKLTEVQFNASSLEARLNLIGKETSEDSQEALALKAQVNDLNKAIEEKDKQIAESRELLDRDHDIRNLIGARNLYIAEIYDVGQSGDTQKPFGRVFYTKDKSLIFYGYDLDQQPGIKKAGVFQAWGGRGADRQHAVSLGLLYKDDANQKRWVLKSNDAKTISQIDAVFVTVEPEGGSAKPSGKPLLFTYLRLDPNHP
jgi:hypothetical protein